LTEEAEEDPRQGWIEPMLVRDYFEIRLESQEVGRTSRVSAPKEVMVGFLSAALRRAPWGAGLVKAKLLDLEREDFIDPFGEPFLLCEGEGKKGGPNNIPVDGIKERGERTGMS
jgi:hypothetical protein